MKIASTTVSSEGMWEERGNKARFEAYKLSLSKAKERGVEIICFPGGFLYASSKDQLYELGGKCVDVAKDKNISIAIGIDLFKKEFNKRQDEYVRKGILPSFAICYNSENEQSFNCRQRSSTSHNQWLISETVCLQKRVLKFSKHKIEILLCGEIFNKCIRASIINRIPKIDGVVDLAHTSQGFRVHAAMKVLAKAGITSFCSVPASVQNAIKYCYTVSGKKKSTRNPDVIVNQKPRIEIKI